MHANTSVVLMATFCWWKDYRFYTDIENVQKKVFSYILFEIRLIWTKFGRWNEDQKKIKALKFW